MEKENFDLKEYRQKTDKPKLKYFFEYLDKKIEYGDTFNNMYFELLNQEDLLESLEYYIENASPARQSAQDYKRDVNNFLKMLNEEYGIRNEVVYDREIYRQYEESVRKIISKLKEQEIKGCITDEKYERLNETIDKFLDTPNLETLLLQDIENNDSKSVYYSKFVSILPVKLAMKYGIGNHTMAYLKINNFQNNILKVNGFELVLDNEMIELFKIYMSLREAIVRKMKVVTDFLFIKADGSSFINVLPNGKEIVDAGGFFLIMKLPVGNFSLKSICYKRIIELVRRGINISFLSQLVEVTPRKILELMPGDELEKKRFENELLNTSKKITKKSFSIQKGNMKCPFCGNEKEAIAENWLLIQVGDEEKRYLACRDCEGQDGKYKY